MDSFGKITLIVLVVAIVTAVLFRNRKEDSIISEHLKDEYDYVVVGAGSAGSVVAARLAEDPTNSILLLEAGGHYDESTLTHMPLGWGPLQSTEFDWGFYTESQDNIFKGMKSGKSYWPRGRIVGGSSILNGMQYTRGSRFDYDEWAANGCKGWDYQSLLPYFLKSEDIQIEELKSSPFHSKGGPIAVSHSSVTGLTDYFLKAGQELGYEVTDYNGADQSGFSKVQSTVRNGVRSSTSLEYLGNTKRPNLDVTIRSYVTKIEIENGKATGVFYIRSNKKYFVKARKEVILSGGAISSPQILMLSGIGPKEDLEKLGIPVKKDLPVGQNLNDHPLITLPTRVNVSYGLSIADSLSQMSSLKYQLFRSGPLANTGLDSSAFLHLDQSKRGKTHPDIQMIFFNFLFTANFYNYLEEIAKEMIESDPSTYGVSTVIALTRPKSSGTLKLRSKDPFDPPMIEPGYYNDHSDLKTMIGGIRIWEKLMETDALRKIGVDINERKVSFCSEHEFRSDAFWECHIRHTSTTEYHHSSTCRMGPDSDPNAVVDLELKVRGIKNLRVVDASIFPNVMSGNTNAPTIMVAEKAADLIRGIDTVERFRNKRSHK